MVELVFSGDSRGVLLIGVRVFFELCFRGGGYLDRIRIVRKR